MNTTVIAFPVRPWNTEISPSAMNISALYSLARMKEFSVANREPSRR